MKILGFEGMNAAGKSSTLTSIVSALRRKGLKAESFKIAGFGKSQAVQELYPKLRDIERRRREGDLTEEEKVEHARNAIIRKTIEIQIKEFRDFLEGNENLPDYIILDRTPMVSWVYSSTMDERQPYIAEIMNESVEQTISLGMERILIFDVEPWMSIARTFMRSIHENETMEQWESRLGEIFEECHVPPNEAKKILLYIDRTLMSHFEERESDRPLELKISYNDLMNQRKRYKQIGSLLQRQGGEDTTVIVNAMNELEELANDVIDIL